MLNQRYPRTLSRKFAVTFDNFLSLRQGLARLILPVYSDTYPSVRECKLPRHENNAHTCRMQDPYLFE